MDATIRLLDKFARVENFMVNDKKEVKTNNPDIPLEIGVSGSSRD